jgi:DNA helicase-2/ATP-dependent DNA helicase PcrA
MQAAVSEGKPLWQILPEAAQNPDIGHLAAQRIEQFVQTIEGFRAKLGTMPLFDLTKELLTTVNYKAELERVYKEPADIDARLLTIDELCNSIARYEQRAEKPTLLGFLEEAALSDRDDQKDEDDKRERQALTLMTLHSAKGLEFPHVYMIGLEEGILPHQRSIIDGRSIDEERRLCYVGVTRAQDTLTLTFCKARMKWGKSRPQIPSRFLMEMRGETERARRAAEAAHQLFVVGAASANEEKEEKPEKKPAKKAAKKPRSTPAAAARPAAAPKSAAPTRPPATVTTAAPPVAAPAPSPGRVTRPRVAR